VIHFFESSRTPGCNSAITALFVIIQLPTYLLAQKGLLMKKKLSLYLLFLALLLWGSGCAIESAEPTPNIAGTAAAMAETIVAEQLTQVAETNLTLTADAAAQITPSPTLTPSATPAPPVTASLPTPFPAGSGDEGACLQAHLVSETIPDGTVMDPGETFNKEWVLENVGSCPWTSGFQFIFNHGDLLGADLQYALPGSVQPGEAVTISIPMIAPAVPGDYLGFWTMQSPDGQQFGTSTSSLFWVQINVKDILPADTIFDLWYPTTEGGLNALGQMNSDLFVGDSNDNQSWQGFVAYNLADLPDNATITKVVMVFEGSNVSGTPFTDLGCLGVYRYNFGALDASDYYTDTPGGALWSFCAASEITAGAARVGSDAALYEIQNSIGGVIQFRFQFNNATDNDNSADTISLFPVLRIEYTLP